MNADIFSLALYAFLIFAVASGGLITSMLIGKRKKGFMKEEPYECGVPAESDSRGRYSVRFYIIAILFVIFDVETIFLFPWAVLYSTGEEGYQLPPLYGLLCMCVFLGILIIGYIWLFRKRALEWV